MIKVVTTDYLKNLDGKTAEVVMIRKDIAGAVDAVDNRQLRFVVSSETIDRDNDIVRLTGWRLDRYRENGIVLWSHDKQSLPIGKVIDLGIDGDSLKATVEFVPADVPEVGPRAEAIYQLLKSGFLSAVSAGFFPLEYEMSDRITPGGRPGLNILAAELVEISVVNIPSLPSARIAQRSAPDPAIEAAAASAHQHQHHIDMNLKSRRAHRARLVLMPR